MLTLYMHDQPGESPSAPLPNSGDDKGPGHLAATARDGFVWLIIAATEGSHQMAFSPDDAEKLAKNLLEVCKQARKQGDKDGRPD